MTEIDTEKLAKQLSSAKMPNGRAMSSGEMISAMNSAASAILAMPGEWKAWVEAVATIMARCEVLEDEAADELVKAEGEHAQGYWRGQKRTAKSIRRELHDLTRALGKDKA